MAVTTWRWAQPAGLVGVEQQHPKSGRSSSAVRLVEDSTSPISQSLKFRLHLIAEGRSPQITPQTLATSDIEVETVDKARAAAYSLADRLLPQTHTIEIESARGEAVERWHRDGSLWREITA